MNAVPDCLLTPKIAPDSGTDSASSHEVPDPEAFERELREAVEARPEDAPGRESEERAAEETPEPASDESRPETRPATDEATEMTPDDALPAELGDPVATAEPSATPEDVIPLAVAKAAETSTENETTPVEILEAREGLKGASEDGAASGDTLPSSLSTETTPAAKRKVSPEAPSATPVEVDLEPPTVDPEAPETSRSTPESGPVSTTRPEASVFAPGSEVAGVEGPAPAEVPDLAAARLEPAPAVTPAPVAEPTAAPEAVRPSTLPSGASPQLTYEAVAAPVRVLAREGGGEARIHLHPAELGRVDVTVVVEDGQVRAALAPERAEVSEMLLKHVPDLEERLADLGLGIDDVSVRTGDSGEQNAREGEDEGDAAPDGDPDAADALETDSKERTAYIGPDGVSVWA